MRVFLVALLFSACVSKSTESNNPSTAEASIVSETDSLDLEFLKGKFEPSKHKDFVQIDEKHADRKGLYLQREAYDAFIKMYNSAVQDSIFLVIRSATRNFDYQKGIWEKKWTGKTILSGGIDASSIDDPTHRSLEILKYSSMPGSSRHHWGTDIDLNSFENEWFASGEGKRIYDWLSKHAVEYGFCQTYTAKGKERPMGYEEEKWHWSYVPLAAKYLAFIMSNSKEYELNGFEGAEVAEQIGVVDHYILGINKDCK